ncbi:MAG: hypothetical protein HYZ43_11990 [Flavobacteriia bacterium]|nr:hypothetical protein [Flavobacteriia bacterium]
MKSALLLFSLLCSMVICAQRDADGINICPQKTKEGYWIYYGKDRPETDIPAEGKVEEGNYTDGRKEGTWIKYHRDGNTITNTKLNLYTYNPMKNGLPCGTHHRQQISPQLVQKWPLLSLHQST